MATVSIVSGERKGDSFQLGEESITLGTSGCDENIPGSTLLAHHATFKFTKGKYVIFKKKTNGIISVNGNAIEKHGVLSRDSKITVADVSLVFKLNGEQSESRPLVAQKKAKSAASPKSTGQPLEMMAELKEIRIQIEKEINKVIIGNAGVIDQVLTAFFAGGHCLLMGVPGLAKTLLVNTLAQSLSLQFKRVQFTPDLMPTDITGTNILQEDKAAGTREFVFKKGPIFTNIMLADEINRTPPKTQAALLEAMAERQITNGSDIHELPNPFLVLATQNPLEQEGTYPLPEAQLDRFLFLVNLDYAPADEELMILMHTTHDRKEKPEGVLSTEKILQAQALIRNLPLTEHVAKYALNLIRATRPGDPSAPDYIKNYVLAGCGPRAGQALIMAAKASTALAGRPDVATEDIRKYALPTIRHRIALNFTAASEGVTADDIVNMLLESIPES